MRTRVLRYNLSESFNIVRWCLVAVMFAFVAIVSVAKYIRLSDMTSITFSALEITYFVLNDTVSIVYIYLPLYLFVICGIMFSDHFGSIEIVKCKSRMSWFGYKYMTLFIYTLLFFVFLLGMNFLIAYQVFPFSNSWSSHFMNVQVLIGQAVTNFKFDPITTISMSLLTVFFLYLCVGTISIIVSIAMNKEAYALLISLVVGILMSVFFVFGLKITTQINPQNFLNANCLLIVGTLLLIGIAIGITRKKDFVMEKKV